LVAASVAVAQGDFAIKNYRQILASLAVVTGVSVNDPDIQRTYGETMTRLPKFGRIDEVNSSMLLALTSLSGMFCRKMIEADARLADGSRRAHNGVDFAQPPTAFLEDTRRAIIGNYAGLFWGRAVLEEEVSLVLATMTEAEPQVGTTAASTQQLLIVACTAMAASTDSFVY
jgi:hypothetical protein